MKELWGSGALGRITVNFIWGVSALVAIYLLYIAYKKFMNYLKGGVLRKVTVKYATVLDLKPPYAKGKVQFGVETPEKMDLTFQIVDRENNVFKNLFTGSLDEGVHPFYFETSELEDGEYFYQLIGENQKNTKKFFIVNNHPKFKD